MNNEQLPKLIEALILAAHTPLTEAKILSVFNEEEKPSLSEFREAMHTIEMSCTERGFELIELATGYTLIAKSEFSPWIQKLWEEKVPKYSKALLETLAIIAYRQPVTRGNIEEIRGVSVSSSIFKTLQEERGWIRIIGHRDVPGRPGIYATTKEFLDYFGLNSLDQLPAVSEILQSFDKEIMDLNTPKQKELQLEITEQSIQSSSVYDEEETEPNDSSSIENIHYNEKDSSDEQDKLDEYNNDILDDEEEDEQDKLDEDNNDTLDNEVEDLTDNINLDKQDDSSDEQDQLNEYNNHTLDNEVEDLTNNINLDKQHDSSDEQDKLDEDNNDTLDDEIVDFTDNTKNESELLELEDTQIDNL
ncbi:MAG: SMC-Scp complex subunit ScpB [Francisellaceae bacterium]|nr:SMC-Scp complex subunit ScpB [Francisellaceae bacterium]